MAPLKGYRLAAAVAATACFHGGDAVAPLKGSVAPARFDDYTGFHGGDAVAPLKDPKANHPQPGQAHVSTAATPWLH